MRYKYEKVQSLRAENKDESDFCPNCGARLMIINLLILRIKLDRTI